MTCGQPRRHSTSITVRPRWTPGGVGDSQRERSRSPAKVMIQQVIKDRRPADRYLNFLDHLPHISWRTCVADLLADHTEGGTRGRHSKWGVTRDFTE